MLPCHYKRKKVGQVYIIAIYLYLIEGVFPTYNLQNYKHTWLLVSPVESNMHNTYYLPHGLP